MWAYVLLNLVASIICVVLIHYIWNYFRDKYTVKKTRDIVGAQTEKYKEMMAELLDKRPSVESFNTEVESNVDLHHSSGEMYISPEQKEEMIRELRLLLIQ